MQTSSFRGLIFLVLVSLLLSGLSGAAPGATNDSSFMKIKVVDSETGQGIPLVRLNYKKPLYTDSNGIVAIHDPGIMGKDAWLDISSPGYIYPRIEFGFPGDVVQIDAGGTATLVMDRIDTQVAERLYRLNGGGIYRHSILVGESTPIDRPVLNGNLVKQGAPVSAVFRDRLYWFFSTGGVYFNGDFNFRISGATSNLPKQEGLDPTDGVNLNYFEDAEGFSRGVFHILSGRIASFSSLLIPPSDPTQMFAHFALGVGPDALDGIARWNPNRKRFRLAKKYWKNHQVKLCSNATRVRSGGRQWFYFSCPFPLVRVPANTEAIQDIGHYQTFTPVLAGTGWNDGDVQLLKDNENNPVWNWKTNTATIDNRRERTLIDSGTLAPANGIHHLRAVRSGDPITAWQGSVYWNEYRQKWIMLTNRIVTEHPLEGRVYYAEADSPIGPWVYARQVATHAFKHVIDRKYSFLDVKQHPYFTQDGGRTIFFSGGFGDRFTDERPLPRYNNNQLMYRLKLTDPRLTLPTPVYLTGSFQDGFQYRTSQGLATEAEKGAMVPFYAYAPNRHERPQDDPLFDVGGSDPDPIPIWEVKKDVNGDSVTGLSPTKTSRVTTDTPVFYAWPREINVTNMGFDTGPDASVVNLYEYQHPSNSFVLYAPSRYGQQLVNDFGWIRTEVIAKVWNSPRIDPPNNPHVKPVQECTGSSAVCREQ